MNGLCSSTMKTTDPNNEVVLSLSKNDGYKWKAPLDKLRTMQAQGAISLSCIQSGLQSKCFCGKFVFAFQLPSVGC